MATSLKGVVIFWLWEYNMKKIGIILILTSMIFLSCASNKSQNIEEDYSEELNYTTKKSKNLQPEISDNFLGDFEPVEMSPIMVLVKSKGSVKPKEIKNVYLVPRTNSIEMHFRNGINDICLIFDKTERDKISEACNTFLTQYEEKTIPHQKVNASTAYFKSKCSLWYGVVSNGNGCTKTDYFLNCEFINKQPYLLFKFQPTRCDNTNNFTPGVELYMSPTQIRTFLEEIKQENLEALVKTLEEKAYTY